MSDHRELDEIMNHIKITPNPAAKEKAKAAFLLRAEEFIENGKESKPKLWKNRQLVYSFASGMVAMLILAVGLMSATNPNFLIGTVRTAGYYEINSPYAPIENGDMLSTETIREMNASGDKFKLYMENGLALYIDTVSDGPITLQYDLTAEAVLAELFGSATGSSIITLAVESGFTGIPVNYEIDLTRGVLDGLTAAKQQEWLSGLYVYCYIVDRDQFARYLEIGRSEAIVSEDRTLPVKIVGKSLYINTDPGVFDADKEMLIFTLNKIDIGALNNSKSSGAGIGGGHHGPVGNIEIGGGSINIEP